LIFPGTEVRLTGQEFPGSSFLPFLKMGTMFPFFQSPGTSPDCHNLSNIVESDMAMTSGNSLRTLGSILSGPIDLCMFRFLRWSQIWSSLTVGGTLPLWSPSCRNVSFHFPSEKRRSLAVHSLQSFLVHSEENISSILYPWHFNLLCIFVLSTFPFMLDCPALFPSCTELSLLVGAAPFILTASD